MVAARVVLVWVVEAFSYHAAAGVKSQLRRSLLEHAVRLGPGWLAGRRTAELATLTTVGIDALDAYFAKYLPQLLLAVVIPAAVVVRLMVADPLAGVTIALTLPLIPLFMALLGATTAQRTRHRWLAMAHLSHHFLDVVAGLPTLKTFGRARAQTASVARTTDAYRQATVATLRLTFLSSMVLELVATFSVALVAVGVGLRLVGGHLGLATGLLVLILAPEALRNPVAATDVMSDQVHHVLRLAVRSNVSVRVIPLGGAAEPSAVGGFALLDFSDHAAFVYREDPTGALFLDDADEVGDHRQLRRVLYTAALDEDDSRDLLGRVAAEHADAADRTGLLAAGL